MTDASKPTRPQALRVRLSHEHMAKLARAAALEQRTEPGWIKALVERELDARDRMDAMGERAARVRFTSPGEARASPRTLRLDGPVVGEVERTILGDPAELARQTPIGGEWAEDEDWLARLKRERGL